MCGIVGFIGEGNVQEVLINGLEKLEYRGYDSAGIYIGTEYNEGYIFKEKGRIASLKEKVDVNISANIGVGHTRWATHGTAVKENAHPHQSPNGRYVLVHNGVIENYKEIQNRYLVDVELKSDTDTEIIAALIEQLAETKGMDTKEAFKEALSLIKGSYAFGLIDKDNHNQIYAAKNKSPLLVGLGEEFNVIVSDAMASLQFTQDYIAVEDNEIITLTQDNIIIENMNGEIVQRDSYQVELDMSEISKGPYPYYMLKEIDEQPSVLRRIVSEYQDEQENFSLDEDLITAISESNRLYIIAAGTSLHAGYASKSLLEKLTGIPVELHTASEFAYDVPLLSSKPFFIFLSQSGETADSRQALVRVNEMDLPSLTITNVKGSTLSREADYTLLLHAGPEIAVASTKAYTAQITVLAVLADSIRSWQGKEARFNMAQEIGRCANAMTAVLSMKESIKDWVDQTLMTPRSTFYIGRGVDYYVAMEAALKLKEISYIQTEAFAAGELKHGTIALIEEGTPVIALISGEHTALLTRGNVEEVKARGADAIIIATEATADEADQFIIPNVENLLSPLASVVITQLIAYYTALGRGLDVDKPRNLAKSVTVE